MIAMKEYSILPISQELEVYHKLYFSVILEKISFLEDEVLFYFLVNTKNAKGLKLLGERKGAVMLSL